MTNVLDDPIVVTIEEPAPIAEDIEPADAFTCDICGGGPYKNERGLKKHKTQAHGKSPDTDTEPKGVPRKASTNLAKELQNTLEVIGMVVGMADQYDGHVIVGTAPNVAQAWSNLAQKNQKVNAFLRQMLTGTAYTEVILATSMMVLPILAHHGMLPAQFAQALGGAAAQANEQE